jgi:hypothetical protein
VLKHEAFNVTFLPRRRSHSSARHAQDVVFKRVWVRARQARPPGLAPDARAGDEKRPNA